jgi:hypothetical protein
MTCPRCKGFVMTQHEETKCLNCAWYYHPPDRERPLAADRWQTILCERCHRTPARQWYNTCADCVGDRSCRSQKVR